MGYLNETTTTWTNQIKKNVPYIRHKIFANFKMFRIYGTRNVSIRRGKIQKIELLILVKNVLNIQNEKIPNFQMY